MGCIHKTKQRCAKQGFDEREESEPSQLGTSTESRPAMSYPSILFQAITVTGALRSAGFSNIVGMRQLLFPKHN